MKIPTIIAIVFLTNAYAQTDFNRNRGQYFDAIKKNDRAANNSIYMPFKNPLIETKTETKGDVYLYPNWKNKARLFTRNNKKTTISGINYNIKNDRFEIKISKDSVFILDNTWIKYLEIDKHIFKKDNVTINGSFCQFLVAKGNITFLKKHKIRLVKGKLNPLNGIQDPNKYHKYFDYYIVKEGVHKKVKLKKKQIVSFLNNNSKRVKKFVAKNNLSYKKERDLIQIIEYYNTL